MEVEDPCVGLGSGTARAHIQAAEFRRREDAIMADAAAVGESCEGAMPSLARGARRFLGFLCLAALASGCTIGPSAPLLSPVEIAKSYGYSETALGDTRYQVTYVAPAQRTGRSVDVRAATTAAERKLAYDLATWRAAQLALVHGYAGFRVGNTNADVNAFQEEPTYLPPPWWGPGDFHRPYFGAPWGPYWEESPFILLQLSLTIEFVMQPSPGVGDVDARQLIEQLRRLYPGAEAAPPPGGV
jgi:hypothetical protein